MLKTIPIIERKVICPPIWPSRGAYRGKLSTSLVFCEGRTTPMLERDYQKKLVAKLKATFPDCIVLKNDAQLKQGIPDLLVLYKNKWAALEVKRSLKDRNDPRPNQEYKVERMNEMSYASFIYPENEDQVFKELKEVFG